jgi:hypothetical protein
VELLGDKQTNMYTHANIKRQRNGGWSRRKCGKEEAYVAIEFPEYRSE